jgi:hypothetical protein
MRPQQQQNKKHSQSSSVQSVKINESIPNSISNPQMLNHSAQQLSSSFFPSASSSRQLVHPTANLFPSFLSNVNSNPDKIDQLIRNFEIQEIQSLNNSSSNSSLWQSQQQQQQSDDYLSNMLLKQLAIDQSNSNKSLQSQQNSTLNLDTSGITGSIWSYQQKQQQFQSRANKK